MLLNTASAVISFLTKLEEETAKFYEKLAQKYPEARETFTFFSKDNRKNKISLERAYYGVITDALEACFSFKEGLNPEAYAIKTEIGEGATYLDALKATLEIEESIRKAYMDAAVLSESLMADVPQTLKKIANKRDERIAKLKSLIKV
jgi:hemoglobin-like flavoprotein